MFRCLSLYLMVAGGVLCYSSRLYPRSHEAGVILWITLLFVPLLSTLVPEKQQPTRAEKRNNQD